MKAESGKRKWEAERRKERSRPAETGVSYLLAWPEAKRKWEAERREERSRADETGVSYLLAWPEEKRVSGKEP